MALVTLAAQHWLPTGYFHRRNLLAVSVSLTSETNTSISGSLSRGKKSSIETSRSALLPNNTDSFGSSSVKSRAEVNLGLHF